MNAYITSCTSDNYIPGVIALYNSLRLSNCNHDFLVIIPDDLSEDSKNTLKEKKIKVRVVDKIVYKGKYKDKILDRYGKSNTSWKTFTKMRIWEQVDYSKLVFLDADTIVLKNIDELFDVEELGAVIGGSAMLNYAGVESGVLVLKPSKDTMNGILDALESDTYDITMSDQSFLNDYFSKHGTINPIPETFNRLWKKNKNPGGAFVFHYNSSKPWIDPSSIDHNSLSLWRHFYESNHS